MILVFNSKSKNPKFNNCFHKSIIIILKSQLNLHRGFNIYLFIYLFIYQYYKIGKYVNK
jgi:hypothetical protein